MGNYIMILVYFFCLFAFWTLLNGTVSILLKQPFMRCMPFSMIGAAFLVYYSQLFFHSFNPGFYVCIGIAVLFIPLCILKKTYREYSLLKGIILLFVILALFLIIDYHSQFHLFDEYYHWGPMVKESIRLDRFYSIPASSLWIHKDYPPFMCMLQIIWCKLCGGYSEMTVLHAINVFNMALVIMPILSIESDHNNKNIKGFALKCIMIFFVIFSIILAFDPWKVSNSILVDISIPLLFGYAFIAIWKMKGEFQIISVIEVVFAQSALIMTKQVGFAFVLILDLYLLITLIMKKRGRKHLFLTCLTYCIVCVAPVVNYLGWKLYTKHLGLHGQFALGQISVSSYFRAFKEPGLLHETLKHYIQSLFNTNITTIQWLPLSFFAASLLILLGLLLLYCFGKDYFDKKSIVSISVVLGVGTIGYAFLMSVLYLFTFNEAEMMELASYTRYMSSYVVGEVIILLYLFIELCINKYSTKIRTSSIFVVLIISLLLFNPANIYNMIPLSIHGSSKYAMADDATFISDRTVTGSKIFIIYNEESTNYGWYGAYNACAQYYLNDRYISKKCIDVYTYNETELETTVLDVIKDNDYIFVKDTNEKINAAYGKYLSAGDMIEAYNVYKVISEAETIKLKKMK